MYSDTLEDVAATRGFDLRDDNVQILLPKLIREAHRARPFAGGLLPVTPRWPVVVDALRGPLDPKMLASVLTRVYSPDHEILVLTTEDDPPEGGDDILIGDIAHLDADVLIAVITPLPVLDAGRDPRTLQHIVARLRQPDGCPWDRKQTNATLRDALIDEVYEAVDAIDTNDMENLAEELGDLVLLVMMHAQIAEEAGQFTLEHVYEGITSKIVRRHPHVFGDREAHDPEDVVGIWKTVKADEQANGKKSTKAADSLPHSMPTLERAKRVFRKHPLTAGQSTPEGRGGELLTMIASIIDAGDDPDTVLRAALARHVEMEGSNP